MKKLLLLLALTGSIAAHAQVVTVTGGTLPSIFLPLNQFSAQGAYEVIYLQSSLNQAGTITRLAFEKSDGTDLRGIDGVKIYLKTTTATQFATGTIDSTGYQRVFKGSFTNSTASGYQEITLNQPFAYNNTSNLSLLLIRTNGQNVAAASNGPRARWLYGTSTTGIGRRYDGASPITSTTVFTATNVLANLRLTFGTTSASKSGQSGSRAGLYPMPAPETVTLDARSWTGALSYFITDALGRTVRPATALPLAPDGQYSLALNGLPAGAYHLHLTSAARHEVLPLVRE